MTFMTLRLIFTQYSVEFEAKTMLEKWNEKKKKKKNKTSSMKVKYNEIYAAMKKPWNNFPVR